MTRTTAETTENTEVEKEVNKITEAIIGCAIEVHCALGPGLLERPRPSYLLRRAPLGGIGHQKNTRLPSPWKSYPVTSRLMARAILPPPTTDGSIGDDLE